MFPILQIFGKEKDLLSYTSFITVIIMVSNLFFLLNDQEIQQLDQQIKLRYLQSLYWRLAALSTFKVLSLNHFHQEQQLLLFKYNHFQKFLLMVDLCMTFYEQALVLSLLMTMNYIPYLLFFYYQITEMATGFQKSYKPLQLNKLIIKLVIKN